MTPKFILENLEEILQEGSLREITEAHKILNKHIDRKQRKSGTDPHYMRQVKNVRCQLKKARRALEDTLVVNRQATVAA